MDIAPGSRLRAVVAPPQPCYRDHDCDPPATCPRADDEGSCELLADGTRALRTWKGPDGRHALWVQPSKASASRR